MSLAKDEQDQSLLGQLSKLAERTGLARSSAMSIFGTQN
jgi:hypothetical protein